jgi:hypothetical protein
VLIEITEKDGPWLIDEVMSVPYRLFNDRLPRKVSVELRHRCDGTRPLHALRREG